MKTRKRKAWFRPGPGAVAAHDDPYKDEWEMNEGKMAKLLL